MAIGPLLSIGSPSGLTTRPTIASPTGTESSSPVAVTVSPSWMWVYSPRMITPTDVSSRLKANPLTPFWNVTISPVMTPERPWTRAIPSPTSRTRPTSVRVTSDWNCSISR